MISFLFRFGGTPSLFTCQFAAFLSSNLNLRQRWTLLPMSRNQTTRTLLTLDAQKHTEKTNIVRKCEKNKTNGLYRYLVRQETTAQLCQFNSRLADNLSDIFCPLSIIKYSCWCDEDSNREPSPKNPRAAAAAGRRGGETPCAPGLRSPKTIINFYSTSCSPASQKRCTTRRRAAVQSYHLTQTKCDTVSAASSSAVCNVKVKLLKVNLNNILSCDL